MTKSDCPYYLDQPYGPARHRPNTDTVRSYLYPTNRSKRDYQYEIVKAALTDNCLVALPTGLGKTFIAGVVMLNCASLCHAMLCRADFTDYRWCGGESMPGQQLTCQVPFCQDCVSCTNETTRPTTDSSMPRYVRDPTRRRGSHDGGRRDIGRASSHGQ